MLVSYSTITQGIVILSYLYQTNTSIQGMYCTYRPLSQHTCQTMRVINLTAVQPETRTGRGASLSQSDKAGDDCVGSDSCNPYKVCAVSLSASQNSLPCNTSTSCFVFLEVIIISHTLLCTYTYKRVFESFWTGFEYGI